jgi:polysaccharide pyruvyl transferase WcaK-like protein
VPTALLAGAFGQRNPGDEALLTSFIDALPGWTTIVPAADPAAVVDRRGRAIRSTAPDALSAARAADAVVFAGGTVFKTLAPSTGRHPHALLARGVALARGARLLGRPVALVGVGAGQLPDRRARLLARTLATSADMLVLRDEVSAQILAGAGVPQPMRMGADAAWTLFAQAVREPAGERPVRGPLVVTLSRHAGGSQHVPTLATGIAELIASRNDIDGVVLEPWQIGGPEHGDDLELAGELQRALRVAARTDVAIAPPPESVRAASSSYRRARVVLGQRFHSLVAAAAAGTPFVAFAHEAKCAALADRLAQPSLRPGGAIRDVAPTIAAALDGLPPDRDAVVGLVHVAETMLELMRSVVQRGHGGCPADLRALRLEPEALLR